MVESLKISGVDSILAAIEEGRPVTRILVLRGAQSDALDGLLVEASKRKLKVIEGSMNDDRFIPVKWMSWREASDLARAHNYRIIGIEDSGDVEPWDADLKGRCMLVIGGERHGISADLLQECDSIVKIPMRGFVPSYNLQAPLAVVAAEALRQRRNNV